MPVSPKLIHLLRATHFDPYAVYLEIAARSDPETRNYVVRYASTIMDRIESVRGTHGSDALIQLLRQIAPQPVAPLMPRPITVGRRSVMALRSRAELQQYPPAILDALELSLSTGQFDSALAECQRLAKLREINARSFQLVVKHAHDRPEVIPIVAFMLTTAPQLCDALFDWCASLSNFHTFTSGYFFSRLVGLLVDCGRDVAPLLNGNVAHVCEPLANAIAAKYLVRTAASVMPIPYRTSTCFNAILNTTCDIATTQYDTEQLYICLNPDLINCFSRGDLARLLDYQLITEPAVESDPAYMRLITINVNSFDTVTALVSPNNCFMLQKFMHGGETYCDLIPGVLQFDRSD